MNRHIQDRNDIRRNRTRMIRMESSEEIAKTGSDKKKRVEIKSGSEIQSGDML